MTTRRAVPVAGSNSDIAPGVVSAAADVASTVGVPLARVPSEPVGGGVPLIDAPRLQYEMAVRGLVAGDLARMAGIDANTVTRALHGRPVAVRTVRLITSALLAQPQLRLTANLIARPSG